MLKPRSKLQMFKGENIGLLTFTGDFIHKREKWYGVFTCKCGGQIEATFSEVVNSKIKSCGCMCSSKKSMQDRYELGEDYKYSIIKTKNKKYLNNLTVSIEDIKEILIRQNFKCCVSDEPFVISNTHSEWRKNAKLSPFVYIIDITRPIDIHNIGFSIREFSVMQRELIRSKNIKVPPIHSKRHMLTFTGKTYFTDKTMFGVFTCDCGNNIDIQIGKFNSHRVKNCGCNSNYMHKSKLDIYSDNYPFYILFSKIEKSSEKRGWEIGVNYLYIKSLWELQDGKCAYTNIKLSIPKNFKEMKIDNCVSIDRIDSSLGYIEGNIQLVHRDINIMKLNLNENDFLGLCKSVYNWRLK